MRKKVQRRMSLRLMENWVLDFMVLDGLEFSFGEKERHRERIYNGVQVLGISTQYFSLN
jgi:hypothetical protein